MVEIKRLQDSFDENIYEMITNMPENTNGFMNRAYGISKEDFAKWIEEQCDIANGINIPEGFVRQIIYIVYYNALPVGFLKIRPELSETLRVNGGNIGIGLLKEYTGKGIGTIALRMAAELLENQYKVKEILITINENNMPSRKMAEKSYFKLQEIEEGLCRYWRRK